MLLGALGQSLPDIDFMAALWSDPAANLLAHRGFTHSVLFGIIATFFLGLLADHYHRQHKKGYHIWLWFFGCEIGTHLLLDFFNSYGMGLLEPFSHTRFSFNALFVVDPFFSIWPFAAFVALLVLRRSHRQRRLWWRFGVLASGLYLLYCTFNKIRITKEVAHVLAAEQIPHVDFLTTPTPLNNWLWFIAVRDSAGFNIGYRSVFDREKKISFHYFPQNKFLLQPVLDHEEVQHLLRFSQGYYTVEKWHDTLVFNDLRFGQIIGWYNPNERFAFHYFLQHSDAANRLVVQRGRFARWDRETIRALLKRIAGKQPERR